MSRKSLKSLTWISTLCLSAVSQVYLLTSDASASGQLNVDEALDIASSTTTHLYTFATYVDWFVSLFRILA